MPRYIVVIILLSGLALPACLEDDAQSCGCANNITCDAGTYLSGGECVPIDCQEEKFSFTQETGCASDGSLEFCIDAVDGEETEAALQEIYAGISCAPGGGRAQCTDSEWLCFFPTGTDLCEELYGALTYEGWDLICRVSELDYIEEIVPTFYE